MANVSFVIDNCGVVTVPEEKSTLAVELILHFAPHWKEMYYNQPPNEAPLSIVGLIRDLFKQLNIPYRVQDTPVYYLSVINQTEEGTISPLSDVTGSTPTDDVAQPVTKNNSSANTAECVALQTETTESETPEKSDPSIVRSRAKKKTASDSSTDSSPANATETEVEATSVPSEVATRPW